MSSRNEKQGKLNELFVQRKISRRDFIRNSMILGATLTSVQSFMAACATVPPAPAAEAPAEEAMSSEPISSGTLITITPRVVHPMYSTTGSSPMPQKIRLSRWGRWLSHGKRSQHR